MVFSSLSTRKCSSLLQVLVIYQHLGPKMDQTSFHTSMIPTLAISRISAVPVVLHLQVTILCTQSSQRRLSQPFDISTSGCHCIAQSCHRALTSSILPSQSKFSHVIALFWSGEHLWVSPSLKGLLPGTPVALENGAYVFVANNLLSGTISHFTILNRSTGNIVFSEVYKDRLFAPIGIFHRPTEGYYNGGKNNQNDIVVWSLQPKLMDTSIGLA